MIPQTFAPSDIPTIGILILLEGLLSADNALVLAIMVKHLPDRLQRKALLYGLGGAFVFRGIAIIFASFILNFWWLQLLGAGYLLWLPIKHFYDAWKHRDSDEAVKAVKRGFWMTVLVVELTDIAFALDSVLVAVGLISGKDKIWVVYAGAVIGIVLLRIAAGFFLAILKKFPDLEHLAYLLVGWVGVKLLLFAGHSYEEYQHEKNPDLPALPFHVPVMPINVFWAVMGAIIVGGTIYALRKGPQSDVTVAEAEEMIEEGQEELAEQLDPTPDNSDPDGK